MTKDPAFLFYSKDFYEGTRMMLPEERACYLDLLIYQHQNGDIPNDLKRLKMYCSGIDEATLEATLKAKFKLGDKGWHNQKLDDVVSERKNFKGKQSINGTVGQFWKKCKAFLSSKDFKELRQSLENTTNDEIFDFIKNKKIEKETLKALLEALLKHLAIEDVIENENEIKAESEEKIKTPFDSKIFKSQWDLYKVFRKKKHKFSFLNDDSENRALTELKNLSGNDEKTAIKIIQQSIDKGWKGLFELKTKATKEKTFETNR